VSDSTTLEAVLRRDRAIVLTSLVAVVAIAWIYLARLAGNMNAMPAGDMMAMRDWGASDFVLTFFMWSVMMVGMMIPSATPAILGFAGLSRERRQGGEPYVSTAVFVLGYLAVWIGFSLLATTLQWGSTKQRYSPRPWSLRVLSWAV
jgi:predicted metal-binding membrane protein